MKVCLKFLKWTQKNEGNSSLNVNVSSLCCIIYRCLKWLYQNCPVTPMLSGQWKRTLMVMFTSFTETNVGPCTKQGGANVGAQKNMIRDKYLNKGEFCFQSSTARESNICPHFQLKSWEQMLLVCRYTGFEVLIPNLTLLISMIWETLTRKDCISWLQFKMAGTHEFEQF